MQPPTLLRSLLRRSLSHHVLSPRLHPHPHPSSLTRRYINRDAISASGQVLFSRRSAVLFSSSSSSVPLDVSSLPSRQSRTLMQHPSIPLTPNTPRGTAAPTPVQAIDELFQSHGRGRGQGSASSGRGSNRAQHPRPPSAYNISCFLTTYGSKLDTRDLTHCLQAAAKARVTLSEAVSMTRYAVA